MHKTDTPSNCIQFFTGRDNMDIFQLCWEKSILNRRKSRFLPSSAFECKSMMDVTFIWYCIIFCTTLSIFKIHSCNIWRLEEMTLCFRYFCTNLSETHFCDYIFQQIKKKTYVLYNTFDRDLLPWWCKIGQQEQEAWNVIWFWVLDSYSLIPFKRS